MPDQGCPWGRRRAFPTSVEVQVQPPTPSAAAALYIGVIMVSAGLPPHFEPATARNHEPGLVISYQRYTGKTPVGANRDKPGSSGRGAKRAGLVVAVAIRPAVVDRRRGLGALADVDISVATAPADGKIQPG